MGEENKSGAEGQEVEGAEDGGANQDESQKGAGADKGAQGADKSADDKGKEGADDGDKKPDEKPTPIADEEPKTRKRNIDFILDRKNKQIEKLKNKGNDADQKNDEDTDIDDGEDDDDLDIADKKIIDNRVKKVLSPFIEKQMQDEDAQEIANFVKQNPDFSPYADKVKKFASHPSRKDMPIESIFYEVAGKDLLKLGAERAKKAADEAKESGAGGGGSGGVETEKSVWELTPEEFAAKQEALRRKPRE